MVSDSERKWHHLMLRMTQSAGIKRDHGGMNWDGLLSLEARIIARDSIAEIESRTSI